MAQNNASDPLHSSRVLAIMEQFEQAWRNGGQPDLALFLPADAAGLEVLLPLVHIDLEQRLKAGERARVEDYLLRFPVLGEDDHAVWQLIEAEYQLRRLREPDLQWDEYGQRFPRFGPTQMDSPPSPSLHPAVALLVSIPGYDIQGILGRGGMGIVYRAHHRQLDRPVALKTIKTGAGASPEELERFQSEARAVARLHHPHIVQIFEVGQSEGQPFFSLEYVTGGSLVDKLNATPQPPHDSARLVETLARAIEHAHQHGIVHRDLKPHNVLLTATGEIKITDFGLAKKLDVEDGHTLPGAILGTPSYMAPEQAAGRTREIGPATDVWALGAILYEMLTGRPPFKGTSPWETIEQVQHTEPAAPSQLQPAIPRDIETICLKCLQKESARRYASALELADDLRRFLNGEPIRARRAGPVERLVKWVRRQPLAAGLVAATLFLVLALTWGGISQFYRGKLQDALETETGLRKQTATALSEVERQRQLVGKFAGQLREHSVQLDVLSGMRLLDEGDSQGALAWFANALELEAGDPQRDPERELPHRIRLDAIQRHVPRLSRLWRHDNICCAALSADERFVATGGADKVAHLWNVKTGKLVKDLPHTDVVYQVWFSPNGKKLATASGDGKVWIWSVNEGELLACLPFTGPVWDLAFKILTRDAWKEKEKEEEDFEIRFAREDPIRVTSDNQLIKLTFRTQGFEMGRVRWRRSWQTTLTYQMVRTDQGFRLIQKGEPNPLPINPETMQPIKMSAPQVFERRTLIRLLQRILQPEYSLNDGEPLRFFSFNPARLHRLDQTLAVIHVAFSPDGRRVVTAGVDSTARLWNLSDGQQPVTLDHRGRVFLSRFSRNGRFVLTASFDGTARLWEVPQGPEKLVLRHDGEGIVRVALPDRGRMLLTAGADGTARRWDPKTGQSLRAPLDCGKGLSQVVFSPDGRRFLAVGTSNTATLWDLETDASVPLLKPPAGAVPQRNPVNPAVLHASFSNDGRWIVATGIDRSARIWDGKTGAVLKLLSHSAPVEHAAFSADGRWLATVSRVQISLDQYEQITVWDTGSWSKIGEPWRLAPSVVTVCFSPDGRRILTTGTNGAAQVCDHAGKLVFPPLAHQGALTFAVFSPDGKKLVTTSADGASRVWDAETGAPLTPFLRHPGSVNHAAFTSDGRFVATAATGVARVWDAATGEAVTPWLRHERVVDWILFRPDGRGLFTASLDGTIREWDLRRDDGPVRDLVTRALVNSRFQLTPNLQIVPMPIPELQRCCEESLRDLESSPERVLAWHRIEAEACEGDQHWLAAVWHLDRLIALQPDDSRLRLRRAEAHLELGDVKSAVADWQNVVEFRSSDVQVQQGLETLRHALTRVLHQRFESTIRAERSPFKIQLEPDRQNRAYRDGEEVGLKVSSEQTGHLYLFRCDADNRLVCLFPSSSHQNSRIEAEQTLTLRFRVTQPHGPQIFKALVSREPLKGLPLEALTKEKSFSLGKIPEAFDRLAACNEELQRRPGTWAEQSTTIAVGTQTILFPTRRNPQAKKSEAKWQGLSRPPLQPSNRPGDPMPAAEPIKKAPMKTG